MNPAICWRCWTGMGLCVKQVWYVNQLRKSLSTGFDNRNAENVQIFWIVFHCISFSLCLALPTVQVGSSGYSGITGGTVTLVCSIISSNPSANSVIWEKDVNGVPTNVTSLMASRISGSTVTQPSLTISSLTAGDTGTYYCSAANSVGRGSRSSTTLTVQSKFPTAVDHLNCMLYIYWITSKQQGVVS